MNEGRRHGRWLAALAVLLLLAHLLLLDRLVPAAQPLRAGAPVLSVRQVTVMPPQGRTAVSAPEPVPEPVPAPARHAQAREAPAALESAANELVPVPAQMWEPAAAPAPSPPPSPPPSPAPSATAFPTPSPTPSPPSPTAAAGSRETKASVAPPMRLHYEVRGRTRGIEVPPGRAVLTWRHDAGGYEALLETRVPLLPSRTQRSTGQLSPRGLEPVRFSEQRRGEDAAHFDRARQRIVFSNNRPEATLEPGAQDRLSVLFQLGALLAARPQPVPPGVKLAMQVVGPRDAESWEFELDTRETLDLPGGKLGTLRLVRLPGMEYDYRLELWLAPELDYGPVRLRLTWPNGDLLDQQWSGTDRP